MNINFYEDPNMFVGIDMVNATRKMLDAEESKICKGMTEQELKAYRCGLDNFASMLSTMLTPEEHEIFVNVPGVEVPEEFDYEDLIDKLK